MRADEELNAIVAEQLGRLMIENHALRLQVTRLQHLDQKTRSAMREKVQNATAEPHQDGS